MAESLVGGGMACCTIAAILYSFGIQAQRDAEILKSAPRIEHLNVLAQLLDATILPMVVAISGRVGSETPIECKMTSGLRGVIVEESVKQHYLIKDIAIEKKCDCAIKPKKEHTCTMKPKKSDNDDTTTRHSVEIEFNRKEVPWYLDDGTGRVHVVRARGATNFKLPGVRSTFNKVDREFVRKTHDNSQRIKILGFKNIERVLPVGTLLDVVGLATKDDVGIIRIQRPIEGPFYVSCKPVDEHIADLMDSVLSDCFFGPVCGCCLSICHMSCCGIIKRYETLSLEKTLAHFLLLLHDHFIYYAYTKFLSHVATRD